MSELAARHGYDIDGNSLSASDEEYTEESETRTESEYESGHYETPADPTPSESRHESGIQSGASFGDFGERTRTPSRPRGSYRDRHRGITFTDMERIFDALVSFQSYLK
jgi:hypothetical protein